MESQLEESRSQQKDTGSGRGDAKLGQYVDLGPEQTIAQMAARHRARVAQDAKEGQPFVDVDVPFVDDGADW